MTIKPLIILPDPLLRQASAPIERVDTEVQRLADDMLATMYDAPGIGLAAIQIGVPRHMLVIDVSREGEDRAAAGLHQSRNHHLIGRAFGL